MGRSSLEFAAVTYYFAYRIGQLKLGGPNFAASDLQKFDELMVLYSRGTRFNWDALFEGNPEAVMKDYSPPESSRAVNVLTALERLAKRDERYSDIKRAYDMLSDFAHPNMASHATVLEMPETQQMHYKNDMSANPGKRRGEFLMLVTVPWISIGVGTTAEILVQQSSLLQQWLEYLDGDSSVTINFSP